MPPAPLTARWIWAAALLATLAAACSDKRGAPAGDADGGSATPAAAPTPTKGVEGFMGAATSSAQLERGLGPRDR